MEVFEVIHCPACGYTQKPRPKRHQWIIPCLHCSNEDVEVYDLVPVARPPGEVFAVAEDPQR